MLHKTNKCPLKFYLSHEISKTTFSKYLVTKQVNYLNTQNIVFAQ